MQAITLGWRCRTGDKDEMAKVEVNGIAMEYQQQGLDTKGQETIIFAHGADGNLLSWLQQVLYFLS